jgi:hypothetical protein
MPMNISDLLHQKKMNQLIITAPALRDAFNELDWSSTFVELLLSPSEPYFRLSTGRQRPARARCRLPRAATRISSFAVTEHQAGALLARLPDAGRQGPRASRRRRRSRRTATASC